MNRHDIRYMIEHRLLPELFYEKGAEFVADFLQDKELLFRIADSLFRKHGIENPYACEQFATEAIRITDSILVMKLCFPEPEEEPLCCCSYAVFDPLFTNMRYFCIEKGSAASGELPFVCAWTEDGTHVNYGSCSFRENEDMIECLKHYIEEFNLQGDLETKTLS
ncbi:MAG: hypothetical protein IJ120_02835 [Solobacterium sp.]|nr:hypothetical protein [Solobacterium sp.]